MTAACHFVYIFTDIIFFEISLDFVYKIAYIYNRVTAVSNGILLKKRRAMPMIVFLPLRAAPAPQCKNVFGER